MTSKLKPKFLTREEREKIALEKREREAAEKKKKQAEEKEKFKEFAQKAEEAKRGRCSGLF